MHAASVRRAPRRIVHPRDDFPDRPRGLRCRGAPPPTRPDAPAARRLRLLEAADDDHGAAPAERPSPTSAVDGTVLYEGGDWAVVTSGNDAVALRFRNGAWHPDRTTHRQGLVPRPRQPGAGAAAGRGRAPGADEARRVRALGRRRRAAREGRRPDSRRTGRSTARRTPTSRPASTSPSPMRARRPRGRRSRASSSSR